MPSPVDPFVASLIKAMPGLRRLAMTRVKSLDRAEDLVQDTMLRALANRDKFTPGTKLDAWLTTIMFNSFRSQYRKRRREVEDPDNEWAARIPIEDDGLAKLEAREIMALIDKMPDAFRVPLRMLAEGADYDEIATETHEHVGTIKSRIARGRALLKTAT